MKLSTLVHYKNLLEKYTPGDMMPVVKEHAGHALHLVETHAMGYTVCIEHGIDHIIDGKPVNLTQRATNILWREADGWRLVHHHADQFAG